MEEDIKILEEFIGTVKEKGGIKFILPIEIHALENLIARYKELETIVKTYNAIPNDYMSNDMKIVIADREYFNNGIFNSKIKSKRKDRRI